MHRGLVQTVGGGDELGSAHWTARTNEAAEPLQGFGPAQRSMTCLALSALPKPRDSIFPGPL